MRHAEDITDLFARYAAEVGRHLPWRGRDDIEREIAATLADRLDDRVGAAGRAATVDDAAALLKETGHPRKAAASYLADTHLIGPALYPLFLLVCRVALPVLAAVLIGALTLSAALGADPSVGFLEHLVRILGSTVGGVLQAFAVIVIVFAVMERANARTAAGGRASRPRDVGSPHASPRSARLEDQDRRPGRRDRRATPSCSPRWCSSPGSPCSTCRPRGAPWSSRP